MHRVGHMRGASSQTPQQLGTPSDVCDWELQQARCLPARSAAGPAHAGWRDLCWCALQEQAGSVPSPAAACLAGLQACQTCFPLACEAGLPPGAAPALYGCHLRCCWALQRRPAQPASAMWAGRRQSCWCKCAGSQPSPAHRCCQVGAWRRAHQRGACAPGDCCKARLKACILLCLPARQWAPLSALLSSSGCDHAGEFACLLRIAELGPHSRVTAARGCGCDCCTGLPPDRPPSESLSGWYSLRFLGFCGLAWGRASSQQLLKRALQAKRQHSYLAALIGCRSGNHRRSGAGCKRGRLGREIWPAERHVALTLSGLVHSSSATHSWSTGAQRSHKSPKCCCGQHATLASAPNRARRLGARPGQAVQAPATRLGRDARSVELAQPRRL